MKWIIFYMYAKTILHVQRALKFKIIFHLLFSQVSYQPTQSLISWSLFKAEEGLI
jgi:hypothetical protein